MDDTGFLVLSVVLIAIGLFLLSPRRYHHWTVLAFIVLVFFIVLIGLPHKLLFFLIVALLLWVASAMAARWA